MTIEKLAELIVAEYYDGSPGSERARIAVEQEDKKLRKTKFTLDGVSYVLVEVEG